VFHHLLSSPIPEPEKSKERLQAEAMVLLIAGSVTSAHTLSLIVYYALSQPRILENLREELKTVMPAPSFTLPSWTKLEKLPYLRSCIKEALR
jgi:cytochrome P450